MRAVLCVPLVLLHEPRHPCDDAQPTSVPSKTFRIAATDLGACFCRQTLSQYVHDKGPIPGTLAMASDPASSLCAKAVTTYLTAHVISIFVALVVGLINYFLRAVIVALVRYEGHPSVAAQQEAVELKVRLRDDCATRRQRYLPHSAAPPSSSRSSSSPCSSTRPSSSSSPTRRFPPSSATCR